MCKISRQRSNNASVKDRIKNYYGANFRSQNNDNRLKTYKNKLTLLICADGKSCDFIVRFRFRWLSSPLASQTIIFSTEQYKSPCNFTLHSAVGEKKKDFKTWVNSWTRWYLWTVFKRVLNFNFDRSPQENSGGLNQNVFDLRGWSTWEWIEVKCRYQATFVLVHLKLKKWNFGWNHRSLLMHSST